VVLPGALLGALLEPLVEGRQVLEPLGVQEEPALPWLRVGEVEEGVAAGPLPPLLSLSPPRGMILWCPLRWPPQGEEGP